MARIPSPFTLTYNIAKPFPFRWFTWIVVAEFVVAIVVFSLISVVTAGYELASVYSVNPNVTESQQILRALPTFLTSKTKPTCQRIDIEVGSTFSTTNRALSYTLDSVQQGNSALSSVVYYNNRLEDCVVNDVLLTISSTDRTAGQIALSAYGVDLSSSITCLLPSTSPQTVINLTASYNYIPSTATIYGRLASFAGRNKTSKASLFWGEEALAMYWVDLTQNYEAVSNAQGVNSSGAFTKGALYLTPGTDVSDIRSGAFFDGIRRLITYIDNKPRVNASKNPKSIESLVDDAPFWLPADSLAKVFYSTIMTDLGQVDHQPNILTSEDLLQQFTSNFTLINSTSNNQEGLFVRPGRILQDYDSAKSETGPLVVYPSTISANYLCLVPRLKSISNLVLSILIADLVFVQALWVITNWLATNLVERRDEKAHWCQGCVQFEEEKSQQYLRRSSAKQDYYNVSVSELVENGSLMHRCSVMK